MDFTKLKRKKKKSVILKKPSRDECLGNTLPLDREGEVMVMAGEPRLPTLCPVGLGAAAGVPESWTLMCSHGLAQG